MRASFPRLSILGLSSLSVLALLSACSGSGSGRADASQNDAGPPSTGGTTTDAGDQSTVTADAALATGADSGDALITATDARDAPATARDSRDVPATGADTRDAPATRSDAGDAATATTDADEPDGGSTIYPTSCDDIGTEPVIPPPCTTVLATKTVAAGVATTDADEAALDTDAIQTAINACPAGQSVKLAADASKNAFLVGPIRVPSGATIWIDAGVTVYASRNPRVFDAKPGACGTAASNSSCSGVFNMAGVNNTGLMGAGTVDGQGGQAVLGSASTWWQLNDAANGGLAAPRLVSANLGSDLVIAGLRFQNSGKFHIVLTGVRGFVIWGVTIITDPSSPNTDGIDPAGSSNGVIAYCKISTGDDNIAIKGAGPMVVDNIIIAHNHFGRGHGMSIGSETNVGVRNVKVCDLSLDGTDNGLRIKSDIGRGGLVTGISYTDVCMRNVTSPLVFNPFYTSGATGTLIPNFQNITLSNVHVLGGGKVRLQGYDATRPLTMTMDNVVFDAVPTITASQAAITLGPKPVNITPSGTGVTVTDAVTGTATPRDCMNAWVTFQ
jgi:polygalacturonase